MTYLIWTGMEDIRVFVKIIENIIKNLVSNASIEEGTQMEGYIVEEKWSVLHVGAFLVKRDH